MGVLACQARKYRWLLSRGLVYWQLTGVVHSSMDCRFGLLVNTFNQCLRYQQNGFQIFSRWINGSGWRTIGAVDGGDRGRPCHFWS